MDSKPNSSAEPKPAANTPTIDTLTADTLTADTQATATSLAPLSTDAFADFPLQMEEKAAVLQQLNKMLVAKKGIDETAAKKLRKTIDELDELNAAVEPDKGILKKSEQLRSRIHKQVEKREKDYEAACLMMDELEQAVKKNELTEAEQKEKKIIALVSRIPSLSEQRSQALEKRLRSARPKLNALESWRHWGTTNAREDLLAQMKQLDGTRLNPEKLAKTIRDAREQWKEWEKSGDHSNKKLWQEFDKACETAYAPCAAHFEKLKAQRNQNRQKAEDQIKELAAYYEKIDWKHPEWKAIDKQLRFARRDYFKITNIDFKHRKRLRAELDALNEKFEAHLGRERQRSLKSREKLIIDAQALMEVTDLKQALDQLDALRKQWLITVLEKRGIENKLWKQFQAAGDAVYARRDDQRKEQFAERDENLKQKSALLEELVTLAQTDSDNILSHASKIAQARDAWQEIGSVPRKVEKNLQNRWREAQKQFQSALKTAKSKAKNAELLTLAKKADICEQLEQNQLSGNNDSTASLEENWQALPALGNAAHQQAIDARYQAAANKATDPVLKQNQSKLEDACLRLELALDLDSPVEFAKQRMAFQIERLSASMSKNAKAQETPESLITILFTTGAVNAVASPLLQKRIASCLKKLT